MMARQEKGKTRREKRQAEGDAPHKSKYALKQRLPYEATHPHRPRMAYACPLCRLAPAQERAAGLYVHGGHGVRVRFRQGQAERISVISGPACAMTERDAYLEAARLRERYGLERSNS